MAPSALSYDNTSPTNGNSKLSKAESYREEIKSFPVTLVTGGSGYIGSHTVLELLTAGVAAVVVDNLYNSHVEALCRVHHIVRTEFDRLGERSRPVPPIFFHEVDIRDEQAMNQVIAFWQADKSLESSRLPVRISDMTKGKTYSMLDYKIDTSKRTKANPFASCQHVTLGKISAVIHFAALKAVGESITKPLDYYQTNVYGLLVLLKAMKSYAIHVLIFSSSAVVYGKGHEAGISEDSVGVAGKGTGGGLLTNPYGRSKWMCEEIINDYCAADLSFTGIALRYFNPTGSHPSALIGEDPKGIPNNIVPVILQAYQRKRSRVHVFGSDYDTTDGTGVRDYIHVGDLARGHLAAMRKAIMDQNATSDGQVKAVTNDMSNYLVYNLGTGHGYSVLEIIKAFSVAAGVEVPFVVGEARPGDLGTVTASAAKAQTELEWEAAFDLQDMCRDVFNWAAANPTGYETLRRMSTLGASSAQNLRKASVAQGICSSENEFDEFIRRASVAIGRNGTQSRGSNVGFGDLVNHIRKMSLSQSSDTSERSSFDSPFASPLFKTSSPSNSRRPSFKMQWADTFGGRRQFASATIEEEDDDVSPDA